jgi:hypothetical protein
MKNSNKKYYRSIYLLISLLITIISCDTNEPPIPPETEKPTLSLTLEDVSCIEAWIKLETTNLELPAALILNQFNPNGDTISQILNLNTQDSLLYVDSLLPNQTYIFQSFIQTINQSSNELNVTTLDTTSHDFTFETFTFGGTAGSSTLYDCAIISPENIWAVGEMYVADTSQNGYTTYNAVHWDGSEWELKRIYYYGACSAVEYPPLKAIWAFSENNIVITNGGSIGWFDGNTVNLDCRVNPLLTGAINKIWGSDSNNLYVVGNNGNIAWYNGTRWTRIESGTEVSIIDVFGLVTKAINQKKVFCAVSDIINNPGQYKILTINENNSVDSLHWDLDRSTASTWSNNGWIVYTSGGGVFNNKSGRWIEERTIPLYYTNRIRGNGLNDIFAVGDFGLLAHYNGLKWNIYQEFLQLPVTAFYSITVKENIMAIVGYNGEKALIIIGRRI